MSKTDLDSFKESKDYVQSIDRMFQILHTFSAEHPTRTTSEIAQLTNLSRPTVRRILLTLEHLGYVKSDHATFSLTGKIIELSSVFLSSQASAWQLAQPFMEDFVRETGESSSISILDNDQIIYVARVSQKGSIMSINLDVGSRLPAVSTSMGQVLLAYLSDNELKERLSKTKIQKFTDNTIVNQEELYKILMDIRARGWGGVDQQLEKGVRSIAVPIRKNDKVVAAINCSVHAGRVSKQRLLEEFLPKLKELSQRIEKIVMIR